MATGITINPYLNTTAAGTFSTYSDGFVQGEAQDDPAVRYQLAGGTLATSEVLPMWGGVGITEDTAINFDNGLGGAILRATQNSNLTGFSVFNQNYAWVQTPQSPVPMATNGMTVSLYRLGTNARIPLQVSAQLASLMQGGVINQNVAWDYTNQVLIPYIAPASAVNISSITYGAGIATVTTASAHGLASGQYVTIAGVTPAGYNGQYVVNVTGPTTFTYVLLTNPGTVTVQGTMTLGGNALPVRILDVNISNSKVVQYDPVTGFATWNNNGSTALVLI